MQKLKENVRNKILSAAALELNKNGFEKTSMRLIAMKAGITPGNIYRYYKNKNDLLEAVVQPIFTKINQSILASTDNMIDLNTDMNHFMLTHDTFYIDVKKFSRLFVEIHHEYVDGLSFIIKNEVYRKNVQVWLTSALVGYYGSRRKDIPAEIIHMKADIASVILLDSVIEILKYESMFQRLQLDESVVIYDCIESVLNKGEILI